MSCGRPANDQNDAEDSVRRGPDRRQRREADAGGALPRTRAACKNAEKHGNGEADREVADHLVRRLPGFRWPVRPEQLLLGLDQRMHRPIRVANSNVPNVIHQSRGEKRLFPLVDPSIGYLAEANVGAEGDGGIELERPLRVEPIRRIRSVSYTHLTLPTSD